VLVDSSRCGKVVHGGTVHEAVTGSSEGAGLALHGGLTVVEKAAQWGRRAEEEERMFHGGGWAPYLATTGGGRRAAVTPTFCKNKNFCANRSTYKIIVLVKNFPKINLA
jgi:hypothetical protein